MVEIHQRVNTPSGSGIVIGTSCDQVLVKYDSGYYSGSIRWEYRYEVQVVMVPR